jgi:ferredoxin
VSESPEATEPGAVEIRIEYDVCMGSGNCLFWAPKSFDLADEGHAIVLDPAATEVDQLKVAAEGCPTGAISIWQNGVRIDKGAP